MTERIYYVDKVILDSIKMDFELIDDKSWYQLYQHKIDKTFWRLDKYDKYQEQIFVGLDTSDNWIDFDDNDLRIDLLLKTRGVTQKKCIWNGCDKFTLKGLVYCERHAYKEMGIRK